MLPNKRRKRQCFGVAKVVSLPSAESSSSTHSLPRGTPALLTVLAPELGRPTLRKGKVVSGNVATPPRLPRPIFGTTPTHDGVGVADPFFPPTVPLAAMGRALPAYGW